MNSILIPSIIIFSVLAIGALGFAPVEQATAVHTTLLANIEDQDRAFSLHTDAGADADLNVVIITLGSNDAFDAEGILTSSGTGACLLEDVGTTALITGTVDNVVRATFTAGAGGFDAGEDIQLDTPADTTCNLFIHVIEWE